MLSIQGLSKTFGSRRVIDSLSFSIAAEERVTVFAPSGSGKTTLINILNQVDRNYEGEIAVTARRPSTIFQEPRLFPYMTVRENIFFPLRIQKTPETDVILAQYQEWLRVCGLGDYQEHYPYQISGGMKQKVSLIRSFITSPDLVMMDEPFKSIDIHSKQQIIQHILETYPDISVLFVTHNLDEIPLLSQTLLLFPRNTLTDFIRYPDISGMPVSEVFSLVFQHLA